MAAGTSSRPGVQERIFLHLSDYVDHTDKVEVPFALSQMGIANAVSIARSNVPRAISGMKEAGHLVERQAHVTGVSRKRKAYFLTDEGAKVADEIWSRISENKVRVIHSDGRSECFDTWTIQGQLTCQDFHPNWLRGTYPNTSRNNLFPT